MIKNKFFVTAQYKRFVEFCSSSQKNKYIGVCYGKPGVGKTESAKYYANWHAVESLLGNPQRNNKKYSKDLINCSTAFYTPNVSITSKRLLSNISLLRNKFDALIEQQKYAAGLNYYSSQSNRHLKLLIVDEADRLSFQCLEQLRDLSDRSSISIILMGMPGIEKRIKRYPQLFSRVGFAYEFEQLNLVDMRLFITYKWIELNLPGDPDNAVASAIARIANGNFRTIHRIFTEIERLQKLNCLQSITADLVEIARQALLLGAT